MIEPNTDALTLVFAVLIVFLPMTLHILFGEDRHAGTNGDNESTRGDQ